MKRLVLVLLLLGCLCGARAQRHYGVADGLPSNQARQVMALADGRLLVQTDGALSVFDGARFRPLEQNRRLRQPIESFFGIDHYLDGTGRLWVKDMSNLYVLDVASLTLLDARSLLAGVRAEVRNVFVTDDGVVWVHGRDDRLYRCHEGDTTAVLTIDSRNAEGINAVVCDVVLVGRRHVVLLSDGTLCIPGEAARQVVDPYWGYRLMGAAMDGHRVVLRVAGGVMVYDLDTQQSVTYRLGAAGVVFQIESLSEGRVLATTRDGVWEITQEGATLKKGIQGHSDLQGAAYDKYGGLWVCTWGDGLLYYSAYPVTGRWQPSTADPLLNKTTVDSHGRVWRSYRYARIETDGCTYTHDNLPALWGNVPFCIEAQEGVYLTCVRMNRLALLRLDEGADGPQIELLTDGCPQLLGYRNVIDACRVGTRIAIASQNGMYAFDCRTLRPEPDYYAAWNENQWSDKVTCLLPQGDSVVWVGTPSGLFRMAGQDYERVSAESVQSLVADAHGRLWMSTTDGRVVQGDRTVVKTSAAFSEHKARLMDDGSLEFLTADSAFVLHPDSISVPQLELTPQLMSLMPATAAYDASALAVDVSALAYGMEELVAYRYRLDGAEEDWHVAERTDGRLHIAYNVVPPGQYVLQVQAAMQGLPWGEMLELPYRVTPPWWRTWWAYTLYIIIGVLTMVLSLRSYLRIQRAQLENERKEARIRALLRQIEEASQSKPDSEVITLSPFEEEFIAKAKRCAEAHLSDADYGVEQFSSDMAMDRSTLYRRLKETVGQSPLEFLRTVRLRQAATLLKQGRHSITEVSELTGFSNRRAFAKYFKAAYGVLPSDY